MKRKLQFLTKTLLVAAGLLAGASSAWADEVELYKQNYQSATDATSWATIDGTNLPLSLQTDNGNKFIRVGDASNGRYAYTDFFANNTAAASTFYSSYTTYTLTFDAILTGASRQPSELVVMANGHSNPAAAGKRYLMVNSGNYNEGTNKYLLFLQNTDVTDNGSTDNATIQKFYINKTSKTVTLPTDAWCTFTLEVTSTKVDYTITNKSTSAVLQSGSYDIPDGQSYLAQGIFTFLHKSGTSSSGSGGRKGRLDIDNILITTVTDNEIVSAPVIGTPSYAGDNRTVTITGGTSSKGNSVNTYYTTNGDTPTSSSTPYTGAITITENCTLKAITISSTDVESTVASSEITVGKLTLNAPTFTKTNYAAGKYTISIASNQTTLDYVPASTTIKYRVGTTGEFATYSTPVEVNAGKVLYAYVEADNYTTSNTTSIGTVSLPEMTRAFGQNYVSVVDEDLAMTVAEGTVVSNSVTTADANYFIPSNDGTNALTNSNISFYFNYNSGDTSQNKYWTLKTTGMYSAFGRGSADVKISNLTAGQIVKVDCSSINSVSGMTKLDAYCSGTTNYYVATGTSASVTLGRYVTLYSIDVYDLDYETIGAIDMSTEANAANSQDYTMRDGDVMKFTFTNHGTTFSNNWRISVKEGETWKANVGADSYDYTAGAATKTSYKMSTDGGSSKIDLNWDRYAEDMADAEVEATLTYSDGTLSMVTTSTGTANGYIYYVDQDVTSLTSNLTINISVNHSWIENLVAKEDVTVSAAGYATYVSANNLDFTSTSIKAYEAKVNAGKVVLTPINKVQAGTGVVLYKEGGATESIPVCTDYDTADDNELVAGTGAAVETTDGSYTNYILNNVSGIGFYKANGQTVASNRAYLHTLTANISGGAPLYMFFNDSETTGINAVKGAEFKVNGEYYDLQGRRVAQPTKGLYIVNGRKVVIK